MRTGQQKHKTTSRTIIQEMTMFVDRSVSACTVRRCLQQRVLSSLRPLH